MALINCDECGNQVSDKAVACPKCGNPIARP
ncbi:MAG: zinc ribbon domain-containing protein, partial [Burkholderiales bacterium]